MAFNYSPKIVRDSSLVLCLDAANPNSFVSGNTVWRDISKGGNNGTLTGGVTYNSSNNGSLIFNGSTGYGSIPYTIQNQFTNKISINAWVNPAWFDSGNNDGVVIIAKTMPTITSPYTIWGLTITPAGKYNSSVGNGVNRVMCTSTNTVSLNTWVNLCMVYDGSIIKLYKNGIQDPTTEVCTYTLGQNTVPVSIGSFQTLAPYFDWFKGNIGVIQLYNKGLSETEVLQNYNALKGRYNLI
jgi:hypothetical protein